MQSTTSVPVRLANFLLGPVLALTLIALPTPSRAGTVAARELGQPDFFHNTANTVDAESLSIASAGAIAVDTTSTPNHLYVVDSANDRVLGYASITALVNGASATIVIGQPDLFSSSAGFTGAQSLSSPAAAAVDTNGNLYVADSVNNRVLIFSDPFTIHANTGQVGGFSAMMVLGQGGDFTSAGCNVAATVPDAETLCSPQGLALDASNNLYVSDSSNNRVLEFTNPVGTGSFVANKVFGQPDFVSSTANNGGIGKSSLSTPMGLGVDTHGNLYVADESNARVLEYNTPLTVTMIAGSGDTVADVVWGQLGSFSTATCDSGGINATSLCRPFGIALDGSNNLYVTDLSRNRGLEYNEGANPPANLTANLAFGQADTSSGSCNRASPTPANNTLCNPTGAAVDVAGDLFITDSSNNRALEYKTPLITGTTAEVVIGQADFTHKTLNSVDPGAFSAPRQVALDASAVPNRIYIADSSNNRVLGFRNAASFANNAQADLVIGQPDFFSSGVGTTATTLSNPTGVAVDSNGNLYVADKGNSRVLEYTAPFAACGTFPCVGGAANMVFGQSSFTAGTCNINGSTISSTSLCSPEQVALDSFNNLYVADLSNNRVLEYNTPLTKTAVSGSGDTTADLVIGQGTLGNEFTTAGCNQGGTESNHTLCNPSGVALDPSDNLYIADQSNQRVLEFNETVAATTAPNNVSANNVFGQLGSFGTRNCNNAGNVTASSMCSPFGVQVDSSGDLFVADFQNNRVLDFTSPLSSQTANVVFGQGGDFTSSTGNIGGSTPSAATLSQPRSITTDASGNVTISDSTNNRVLGFNSPFQPPGFVIHPPSSGILRVSPLHLAFGSVKRGKTSGSRNVIVTNDGEISVNLGSLTVTGDFSYSSSCGPALTPGQSCVLEIFFKPMTIGRRGGSIAIGDDAQGSPHLIDLFGHGKRTR